MKIKPLIILYAALYSFCFGQSFDPFINGIINETNLDSLVSHVRILSGEDSVMSGDSTVLITHRISYQGNDLAADYIKQKLVSYGLETYDQIYSSWGRNIYSVQRGTKYPEKYFIYCAHYDAEGVYCADDNASGVAGVLEAARILSNHKFDYSIIYAFWDEEEAGRIRSRFYASECDSNDIDIEGVLNFEMSGWDGDDDGLMDIHTRNIANSVSLSNFLVVIDSLYNLPLKFNIYNPGTRGSDHASFWDHNYSAIVFSEAYYGGDFNPYYHTNEDRIERFNIKYFYNVVKLGIAAISTLAKENFVVSMQNIIHIPYSGYLKTFPNPFNNSTVIQFEIPEDGSIRLELYNSTGEMIKILSQEYKKSGKYELYFDGNMMTSGIYFIILITSDNVYCNKILHLK